MSADKVVVDTVDWLGAGKVSVGDTGGGVLAENLASSGEDGPGFLYESVNLPADNRLEIAGRFTTIPAGLDLTAEEDGELLASAAVDGTYTTFWQMYVNMVPTGPLTPRTFVFGTGSGGGAVDTTPPEMQGVLSYSNLTATSARVSWQAATDDVGVTGYSRTVNGTSVADIGNTLFTDVALLSGTSNTVSISAYDAAGNDSDPLTIEIITPAQTVPTFTGELVGDFGQPHANMTGWTARIYDIQTGQLIASKTNLFTDADGLIAYTEAACVRGTTYDVIYRHPEIEKPGLQLETPS